MSEITTKGPRPVRGLFNLGVLSLASYAVAVACLTPTGHTPSLIALGVALAVYAACLFSLHVFVRGEQEASKEAAELRQAIGQAAIQGEAVYRKDGKSLIVRTRPGRIRACGFTLVGGNDPVEPGQTVQLKHYSLLKAPFHMVDTWTGPVEVSADGKTLSEVRGKAGPTRRSVWWATPGSITFAPREEVADLLDLVRNGKRDA